MLFFPLSRFFSSIVTRTRDFLIENILQSTNGIIKAKEKEENDAEEEKRSLQRCMFVQALERSVCISMCANAHKISVVHHF